jgi:HAD superfamily hydrolase (TIGR01509 family)
MQDHLLAGGLALIFDLDGVIVDSMPVHTAAWIRYLDGLGLPSNEIDRTMHGRRNDEIVTAVIGAHLSAEQVFAHGAAKEALFREMIGAELVDRLVPGVTEFLHAYQDAPLGLASNAEPANIHFVLEAAGLSGIFRTVVDGMQVERPKPFPDVYTKAASALGIEPPNCIVFEDSPAGVAAARAAGARVVGVETHAPLEGVDFRIHDFRESELIDWLAAQQPRAGVIPER